MSPDLDPRVRGGDATFLERLRAGDEDAFERLVRDHTGRLLAVARRLLRSEEDARDAVQESFGAVFRSLGTFQGGSSLSTWMHRIVINACLMKLRVRARHVEQPLDELLPVYDEAGHGATPFAPWAPVPEAELLSKEARQTVRAAIDRLPGSYRTVLVLRDLEDLDTDEVARLLSLSPNAVKIRLHRARQALRTLLAPAFAPGAASA